MKSSRARFKKLVQLGKASDVCVSVCTNELSKLHGHPVHALCNRYCISILSLCFCACMFICHQ